MAAGKVTYKDVQGFCSSREYSKALLNLKELISEKDPYTDQFRASKIINKIDQSALSLRDVSIVILASSTVDHLAPIVKLWLALEGINATVTIAPYDSIAQTVFDPNSLIYSSDTDVVWFFSTWRDIEYILTPQDSLNDIERKVKDSIAIQASFWEHIKNNSKAYIVQNNIDIPHETVLGNFEASVPWSQKSFLQRYNLELQTSMIDAMTIFDLEHISASYGKARWVDKKYWYHSKNAIAFDALGLVSFHFAKCISAIKGLSNKCLVLDLDNTLWGGVIGDDGLGGIKIAHTPAGEAHLDLQKYVSLLKQRGIILAVCSKNEDILAKEPFEKHPDMHLALSDIAVFIANWDNKADNIVQISKDLNIGLDAMVFLDDNPVERALVKEYLPMVSVPELSDDPVTYVKALYDGHYFETVSFSEDDSKRATYYRDNSQRKKLQQKYSDLDGFQKSLNMVATTTGINELNLSRCAQLINKSNQFNLTGKRYTESDLQSLVKQNDWTCLNFSLEDRFGKNGVISVVLLNKVEQILHIHLFVMSCRVLGRGMEEFIINSIVKVAKEKNCDLVVGEYIPSQKNMIVKNLYQKFGFSLISEEPAKTVWQTRTTEFESCKHFIASDS